MSMPRPPQVGDVVRFRDEERQLYAVVVEPPDDDSMELQHPDYTGVWSYDPPQPLEASYKEDGPGWMYANPNRMDHADIPKTIWQFAQVVRLRQMIARPS